MMHFNLISKLSERDFPEKLLNKELTPGIQKIVFLICILAGLVFLSGFSLAEKTNTLGERIITTDIPAPSLKNNHIRESLIQENYIYLPSSYFDSQKRYPVIYFFEGFGVDPISTIISIGPSLDALQEKKQIAEFIVVNVNGYNNLGGSFFVNSPVTGNWEDYLIRDVIPYIDQKFRTLDKPSARGAAGFGMGGFAALNLAFRHPDVFGIVYGLDPSLLDKKGLQKMVKTENASHRDAYSAAFSPNLKKPFPHGDIPQFNGTARDNRIVKLWESGFGNLQEKIDAYLKKPVSLKAIRLEYGTKLYDFESIRDWNGSFEWIAEGCIYLSQLLTKSKINHELLTYDGGFDWTGTLLQKDMYPFFSEHLELK